MPGVAPASRAGGYTRGGLATSASLAASAPLARLAPCRELSVSCPGRKPPFWDVNALRAHTKAPHKTDSLWETLRAFNRPGQAHTVQSSFSRSRAPCSREEGECGALGDSKWALIRSCRLHPA